MFLGGSANRDSTIPAALFLPPPAYGGGGFDSAITGINTGATWNQIWTPNIIMSIRAAWNYGFFKRDNPAATNGELLNRKYGIKGGNDSLPGGCSAMNITGYQSIGIGANNPVARDSQNRQLIGDVTWTHGTHTLKFGGSVLRSQNNIFNIDNEVGGYTFNGQFAKDGMADFLLGMVSSYTWNTRLQVNLRSSDVGAFAQDDWKITPNLTLNLGVRYDVVLPFTDKRNRMGVFDDWTDPNNPHLILAGGGDRYNRAMVATDWNNLMPRAGFAYKLGGKTVVRSGYGVFYGYAEPAGDTNWLIVNPPYAYTVTLSASASTPAFVLAQGPPAGALDLTKATGLTLASIERKANSPYAQQWNLNIQRELLRDWMLEVGYS